jgi:D-inositol-3-phosphate glycosyltransferase
VKHKPRIFVVSFSQAGTGFGRLVPNILHRLVDSYDIHHFELAYDIKDHDNPWKVYSNQIDGDPLGECQINLLVEQTYPSLILLVGDIWTCQQHLIVLKDYLGKKKIVAYCAVDYPQIADRSLEVLGQLARLVVFTEFAKRELLKCFKGLEQTGLRFSPPQIEIIPLGVDTTIFYPYSKSDLRTGKRIARQVMFPNKTELLDAFIVFNGNRNALRKRIDLTLEGFSLFAADKPDNVKLYLHMGYLDIMRMAKLFGIADRLLFTSRTPYHPNVSDQVLNRIYNACNVGINTSMGEGWGLVSFEHAATGAAQIVPKHTSCDELWCQHGLLLDASSRQPDWVPRGAKEVAPQEVAAALQCLYDEPGYLEALSWAAFQNATRPEFKWDYIAERFDNLFQEVLGKDEPQID